MYQSLNEGLMNFMMAYSQTQVVVSSKADTQHLKHFFTAVHVPFFTHGDKNTKSTKGGVAF